MKGLIIISITNIITIIRNPQTPIPKPHQKSSSSVPCLRCWCSQTAMATARISSSRPSHSQSGVRGSVQRLRLFCAAPSSSWHAAPIHMFAAAPRDLRIRAPLLTGSIAVRRVPLPSTNTQQRQLWQLTVPMLLVVVATQKQRPISTTIRNVDSCSRSAKVSVRQWLVSRTLEDVAEL